MRTTLTDGFQKNFYTNQQNIAFDSFDIFEGSVVINDLIIQGKIVAKNHWHYNQSGSILSSLRLQWERYKSSCF